MESCSSDGVPGLRSCELGEPLWQLKWESEKKLPLPAGQLLSAKSSRGLPCAVCEQTAPACCVSGWDAAGFLFRKLSENAKIVTASRFVYNQHLAFYNVAYFFTLCVSVQTVFNNVLSATLKNIQGL